MAHNGTGGRPSIPDSTDKPALRRALRAQRCGLDAGARVEAAGAFARSLLASDAFRRSRRIAAYIAADGEIDPGPFLASARSLGREIYLPRLDPVRRGTLRFVPVAADEPLFPNRYGIPEPAGTAHCPPAFLDLVIVPLVGFDSAGNRLGMGAGYYDRSLAYLKTRRHWRKPRLIGAGYAFQQVETGLEGEPWDVPLWAVATENGVLACSTGW